MSSQPDHDHDDRSGYYPAGATRSEHTRPTIRPAPMDRAPRSERMMNESDVVALAPDSVPGLIQFPEPPTVPRDDVEFDPHTVRRLSSEELHALPYGVVVVDARGTILEYSDTEARMVGLERSRVLGKNFFEDVAPCTRIRTFLGRFQQFVAEDRGFGVEQFDFVFRFRHSVQSVTVFITAGSRRGSYAISMLRRSIDRLASG
ncbi:MAG: PAS domain-containing protein [Myxococcota bacterium]